MSTAPASGARREHFERKITEDPSGNPPGQKTKAPEQGEQHDSRDHAGMDGRKRKTAGNGTRAPKVYRIPIL